MKILKWLVSISIIFLIPRLGMCDGESFDVISIKKGSLVYHFRISSQGLLKNNDLCYYNYEGEYMGEVKDIVKSNLPDRNHYGYYYKNLERISLGNIPIENRFNRSLCILKDSVSFDPDSVLESLDIVSAENEFSYINIYSPDLDEKDNIWLNSNTFEILFDYLAENCDSRLYGIQGQLTRSETEYLKLKIEGLLRQENWDLYIQEIRKLYKRKIIMLGFCHC